MKSLIVLVLVAAASATLASPPKAEKAECSNFQNEARFDCFPQEGASQQACEARGCCWVPAGFSTRPAKGLSRVPLDVPWCFYPKDYRGYKFVNSSSSTTGQTAFLQRQFQTVYPRDVQIVRADFEFQTENRLRVKLSDAENQRYEAPYPKITSKTVKAVENPNYKVEYELGQQGFVVKRTNGEVIFNSNVGGFIFSDLFLQISTTFNGTIYGLGEHRTPLALNTAWTRVTMFNHDTPPREDGNLYGSHPFYLVVNENGQSYGVFLQNSNAMDVLLQPLDALTFRPIGGILDFYFFMGPTPSDVIKQYTELIGRPFMPPYWSLGYQLCRYGYNSVDNTRAVWQRTRDTQIPFDVQWNDIDYMLTQNDFTIDPNNFAGLPDFVKDVHDAGMHYVPILDPGVSAAEPSGTYPPFDDGVSMDIFVKDKDNKIFIAKVWNPTSTAFPDFTNPKTEEYWKKQVKALYDRIPFDGMWIDMNEPANFIDGSFEGCPQDELETPPYLPAVDGGKLSFKTVCMTAKQYAGIHYNLHNLYGISEAEITQRVVQEVTGKRGFVLSRSTFAGSGAYTGHWSGDDQSVWHDLQMSIPEILQSNMYGIPYVGADICGFRDNTNNDLCNRWTQLGAFYPFARNHNTMGATDQDPAVFGDEFIASAKKALNVRYTLLPYLYTLFYRARVYGETVARPLFMEFPEEKITHRMDTTFLWGSGIYIIPILTENTYRTEVYLPNSKWYDWYTLRGYSVQGSAYNFAAPYDTINVLIRGGNVIPTQAPAVTTTLSRKNGFTFIAAPDENNAASGTLFWDDGDSLNTIEDKKYGHLTFTLSDKKFVSKVDQWDTTDTPQLDAVKILGISGDIKQVTVNGKSSDFRHGDDQVLIVSGINLPLNTPLEVTWS